MIIQPYKASSKSARALATLLNCKRMRLTDSRYRGTMIVNWGSSLNLRPDCDYLLNLPDAVRIAGCKLESLEWFRRSESVNIPEYTTDYDEAQEWLEEGKRVVCRDILRGNSGAGITLCHRDDCRHLPNVSLYTRYVPKRHEYRVHIFQGAVVDVQQKRQRRAIDGINFQIRSHDNGWVFCRRHVAPPTDVLTQAVSAVSVLGLDFGAVDVGWNERNQEATVYEVNTAPGLEGTTLEVYKDKILEAVGRKECEAAN